MARVRNMSRQSCGSEQLALSGFASQQKITDCRNDFRNAITLHATHDYCYICYTFSFQVNKRASIRQRIDQRSPHNNVFYSILVIDKVQKEDQGLYTCRVRSGLSLKSVNASVHIYGKQPFAAFQSLQIWGRGRYSSINHVNFLLERRQPVMKKYNFISLHPLSKCKSH